MATSHLKDPVPERHFTYLVVIPDVPNSNRCVPDLRQEHVENAKVGYANGRIIDGAGFYGQDPATMDHEPTLADMRGSMQIVRGASIEDVRDTFSKDVYTKGGTWDLSRIQIYPIINRPLK